MHGKNKLKLLIKSIDKDEIGTIISQQQCNTNYPIVSCTKKEENDNNDKLTFLLNKSVDISRERLINKIDNIISDNGIRDYSIDIDRNKIIISISKRYSISILNQIHDAFIDSID